MKIHLRCEVENHVRVGAGDDTDELRCLDVGAYEAEPSRMSFVACECVRKVGRTTRAQIVYANNLVALRKQSVHKGGADESGSAGDQDTHFRQLRFPNRD